MEIQRREQSRVTAPVKPFIELDAGEFDIRAAAGAAGFVLGALIVAALGALVVQFSLSGYEPSYIAAAFGGAVASVALVFGAIVLALSVMRWCEHADRLRAWHTASLDSYVNSRGVVVADEVTEYTFSADDPLHVLWVALEVQRRVAAGEDTPFSARELRGPLFFGSRRVGELSKGQAERMSQKLAALGYIEGRREGCAGRWRAEGAEDVVLMLRERWGA